MISPRRKYFRTYLLFALLAPLGIVFFLGSLNAQFPRTGPGSPPRFTPPTIPRITPGPTMPGLPGSTLPGTTRPGFPTTSFPKPVAPPTAKMPGFPSTPGMDSWRCGKCGKSYTGAMPPGGCSLCGVTFTHIREADGSVRPNPGVTVPGGPGMPGGPGFPGVPGGIPPTTPFTPPGGPLPGLVPPGMPATTPPIGMPPVTMPAVAMPPVTPPITTPPTTPVAPTTTRTEGYRCEKCGKTFFGATPPTNCSGCGVRFGFVREADGSTRTVNGGGLSGGAWAGIVTGILFLMGLVGLVVKQVTG